ncbi:hypothetical protein D3C76_1596840 [compost metagenome]
MFDLFAWHPAYLFGGVVQGALHFGDARDWDIRWQHCVEHVVVAQIRMGQHIVTN